MPGFTTHYIFGQQAASRLEQPDVRRILKKYPHCYNLGLQGPDIFFYYLPAYFLTKRNVGNLMHDTSTMAFFSALMDARNLLKTQKARSIADAYIYGFIGHYSLDTVCHPYIYARSRYLQNKDRPAYDFGCHVSLETDIDRTLLWHYHCLRPSQFTPGETIHVPPLQMRILSLLLARAIFKTYPGYFVTPLRIRQAAKFMRLENNWMHDPSGRKKYFVRSVEQLILGHGFISTMIPSDSFVKYKDCMNLRHKKWANPWNPKVGLTLDFYELMEKAGDDFLRRAELYEQCVSKDAARSLEDYCAAKNSLLSDLGDCSYLSGFPLCP